MKVKINKYNSAYADVIIQEKDFKRELALIKNMPVRYYDKDSKLWSIPLYDLKLLKDKTKKSMLRLTIQDQLKDNFRHYRSKIKELIDIKNHNGKTFINEMDILAVNLYPFQTVGAYFLYKSKNAILGDSVGLGKTAMALAATERWFNEVQINSAIVICPSTLKRNWENEIKKFTERTVTNVDGSKAKRKAAYKQAYKTDFVIIAYDTLFRDYDELISKYIIEKNFIFTLILDELQKVKNSTTKRSKFVRKISERAKFRIGLSATPIENNIMDLFNVYHVIDNKIFGDGRLYKHFQNNYCKLDYWGGVVGVKNENAEKTIIKRMSHAFIKRFKEDVLDQLPERIESNFWIKLSNEQRNIYDDIKHKIIDEINDKNKATKVKQANVFAMLIYLRQVCLSAKLLGVSKNISTKTDFLLDFIDGLDGKSKIVIFVHFKMMLQLLKESLIGAGYNLITITAEDKFNVRIDKLNEFNNNKNLKILLTGDVLTEGVNISSANYLINFDMLFNPAKMEQRNGRIDRLDNVHKTLNIVNLIAEDTVEEHMFEILESKKSLYKTIIDEDRVENRITLKNIGKII